MASFNGTQCKEFLDGIEQLCNHFKEDGSKISRKNLGKKKFFSQKKDLNLVLYTMSDMKICEKTEEESPHWKIMPEVELTDDLIKTIKENAINKLNKRNNSGPKVTIIGTNIQIGDNNTMTMNDSEELCQIFQKLKLPEI